MEKSWRTTTGGLIGGAMLIFNAFQHAAQAVDQGFIEALLSGENMTLLGAGIGIIINGLTGRDDKVTSEGGLAPKAS